jgi:hypothetical protein
VLQEAEEGAECVAEQGREGDRCADVVRIGGEIACDSRYSETVPDIPRQIDIGRNTDKRADEEGAPGGGSENTREAFCVERGNRAEGKRGELGG